MPRGSLIDGFFFSVEPLGTVGYGNMAPATHPGHAVAALDLRKIDTVLPVMTS